MKRTASRELLLILAWIGATMFCVAEQPPETAFHSTFDFQFHIPSSFKSAGSNRGYLETPPGKAPYSDQVWRADKDSITIRAFVVPEVSWQASPEQMFAGAKQNMMTDPNLKLVSERDYKVGDCPAHSFVFSREGEDAHFERMDYILTKPDLNIVVYASPTKASLDGPACKELFQSISVRAKTPSK